MSKAIKLSQNPASLGGPAWQENETVKTLPKRMILVTWQVRSETRQRYYYNNSGGFLNDRPRTKLPLPSDFLAALKTASEWEGVEIFASGEVSEADYRDCFLRAKKRGRAGKIEWAFTEDDFQALRKRASGRCQLTGVAFSSVDVSSRRFRRWMPSLDRIDSSKGYTPENVRLVLSYVNLLLNEFGLDSLLSIAEALLLYNEEKLPLKKKPRKPR